MTAPSTTTPRPAVLAAFGVIYLVWGSTFLAIKVAVAVIPPLLLMSIRSLAAGGLLFLWAKAQGVANSAAAEWRRAGLAGVLLFLVNHGGLAWAEQRVPSGIAAVLVATIPLWVVLLDPAGGAVRRTPRVMAGVVLGFLGSLLIGGLLGRAGGERIDPRGAAMLACGALSWAIGTLYSRRARFSESVAMGTSMPMLAGGTWLLCASLAAGEWARLDASRLSPTAIGAVIYLIVAGSLLGFSCYMWLLRVDSPARVATYAYVNPVVAMLIGWLAAGETVSFGTVLAVAISLAGVFLVVTARPVRRS